MVPTVSSCSVVYALICGTSHVALTRVPIGSRCLLSTFSLVASITSITPPFTLIMRIP